jgi:LPXTG-site transpeptidase (sortase) family protein
MNQILNTNNNNSKLKKMFKFQFYCSIILVVFAVFYYFVQKSKTDKTLFTKYLNDNANINKAFENSSDAYLGKIKISKINLEYYVFNEYSNEKLKLLPCKFYGENLRKNGNICILAHNYYDNRFFGNLNKLQDGDVIIMEDLSGNSYKYIVYKIYEIDADSISEVQNDDGNYKTLTLKSNLKRNTFGKLN